MISECDRYRTDRAEFGKRVPEKRSFANKCKATDLYGKTANEERFQCAGKPQPRDRYLMIA